jgi:hypothetical protein
MGITIIITFLHSMNGATALGICGHIMAFYAIRIFCSPVAAVFGIHVLPRWMRQLTLEPMAFSPRNTGGFR